MAEPINPEKATAIKLKLKYRERKHGGANKSTGGSAAPKKKAGSQGWGVRRRAYGPFNTF
jgi:hypothetical protein